MVEVAEWLWQEPRATTGRPGDIADEWCGGGSVPFATGLMVNADAAMRVSAAYACVRLISESLAMLPLVIYKKRPDGGKDEAINHPLYDLLAYDPNDWQTSYECREMLQMRVLLRGNAYAKINAGPRGFADSLEPIHPDRIKPVLLPSKRIGYDVQTPT